MKKYTTIAQKGEMAYGQPTYPVAISANDLVEHGELLVRTKRITTTVQVDDEEPKTSVRYSTFTIGSIKVTIVNKWRKAFTQMGFRCPEPPSVRKGHYLLYGSLRTKIDRRTLVSESRLWAARVNCYQDVADLATYFGDRLPQAFYDKYASILVEIPDVQANIST